MSVVRSLVAHIRCWALLLMHAACGRLSSCWCGKQECPSDTMLTLIVIKSFSLVLTRRPKIVPIVLECILSSNRNWEGKLLSQIPSNYSFLSGVVELPTSILSGIGKFSTAILLYPTWIDCLDVTSSRVGIRIQTHFVLGNLFPFSFGRRKTSLFHSRVA